MTNDKGIYRINLDKFMSGPEIMPIEEAPLLNMFSQVVILNDDDKGDLINYLQKFL
jgi:hypothetical protein